jgi:hypothetical protein
MDLITNPKGRLECVTDYLPPTRGGPLVGMVLEPSAIFGLVVFGLVGLGFVAGAFVAGDFALHLFRVTNL